jgi:hypothetical protein
MRLIQESSSKPPALQANTLCKEPFEQRNYQLFGTSACPTSMLLIIVAAPDERWVLYSRSHVQPEVDDRKETI